MATDTGYLNYILSNPDLRENAEAAGLTQAEMIVMGRTHWEGGGKNEGRLNSPDAQDFAPGFTQTLGPEHYQGRDVEDVLQASVRAGDPSEMWGAREDISPDWNLGQYTAEGWNMAADQPYGTGILANQIEVNPDIGQLVPTTAAGNVGNLNFIQDRYLDTALANDFPAEWVTNNAWTGPENLGGYWEDLTSATGDDVGILGRVDPYDPTTAARPSTVVGPRGTVTGGPPNPTVPSFGYPQYQDWTRFMPTNFQLAEGGGMHYQPWATGIPQGGGGYGWNTGGPIGSYPPGGGGGGGTTVGPINPNIWGNTGTTGSSNTTTDASGNRWVMSTDGQWVRADSEYGQGLLGDARLFPPHFYDANGAYIGSEGQGVAGNVEWGGGAFSPEEWGSGIAGPNVTRLDQWGNPVSMGNRQIGLNITKMIPNLTNWGPFTIQKAINTQLMLEEAKSLSPDWSGADTDVDISDSEVDIAQGVI